MIPSELCEGFKPDCPPDCLLIHWWDKERLEAYQSRPIPPIQQIVTFTCNPKFVKVAWWNDLLKALEQKCCTFSKFTIEHMNDNIHCHTVATSKHGLCKDKFKSYCKKHMILFRKIGKDNGIEEYFSKENTSFDNKEEFKKFFQPLIYKL